MIVSKTAQKFEYRKRNINMIQKKEDMYLKKDMMTIKNL